MVGGVWGKGALIGAWRFQNELCFHDVMLGKLHNTAHFM